MKSTVGHLLTGAGAAAVAKVLLAMQAEHAAAAGELRATAADGLRYADGPFRVLREAGAVGARASRTSRGGPRSAGSGSAG